jgi:hypothetical protein
MTGEENQAETEQTLSKKFTVQPSNTYIVDGTSSPILAARLEMLNPTEVGVKYVTGFNQRDGSNTVLIQITDQFGGGPVLQQPIGLAINAGGGSAMQTVALQALSNVVISGYESVRTPTIFRHALCTTAAATAVWDPAAGKKFRIMGYVICPDAGLLAAGAQLITFLDQAAAITIAHQTYLPIAASIAHQVPIVVALPGNGYLSTAADNILNVTMTSNVTAGAVSIFVYGTEE